MQDFDNNNTRNRLAPGIVMPVFKFISRILL